MFLFYAPLNSTANGKQRIKTYYSHPYKLRFGATNQNHAWCFSVSCVLPDAVLTTAAIKKT